MCSITVAVLNVHGFYFAFYCSLGDKALDGYSKKKYVCKLLFIFLLGHDIDFGHMEAVNLLSSNKYTEKQIVSNVLSLYCDDRVPSDTIVMIYISYR